MLKNRWIGPILIPLCLAITLVIGAERSHPANAGGVIDPTCTSSLPCIEYDNNGAGPGIRGLSLRGNGVGGSTRNNSTTAASGTAGIFGKDESTSGTFDSGVRGQSVLGTGTFGHSVSGTGAIGSSTTGTGVLGTSSQSPTVFNSADIAGVAGQDTATPNPSATSGSQNLGVSGVSNSGGTGVLGQTGLQFSLSNDPHGPWKGVEGQAPFNRGDLGLAFGGFFNDGVTIFGAPGDGVYGAGNVGLEGLGFDFSVIGPPSMANPGTGIMAKGNTGAQIEGTGPDATGQAHPALYIQEDATSPVIQAAVLHNGATHDIMSLDTKGNMIISGKLTQHGTPLAMRSTAAGANVITYSAQQSEPTIEDLGEGRLINGKAYIRFDPTFSTAIDRRTPYLVFITPDGENRGLYVSVKSAGGFAVRENGNGSSNIIFDYRVVGKPFGEDTSRLPVAGTIPHMKAIPNHNPLSAKATAWPLRH